MAVGYSVGWGRRRSDGVGYAVIPLLRGTQLAYLPLIHDEQKTASRVIAAAAGLPRRASLMSMLTRVSAWFE